MYDEIGNIRLAQHLLGKGIFLEEPVSGGLKGVLAQVPVTTGAELSEVLKYFEVYAIRPKGDRLEINYFLFSQSYVGLVNIFPLP